MKSIENMEGYIKNVNLITLDEIKSFQNKTWQGFEIMKNSFMDQGISYEMRNDGNRIIVTKDFRTSLITKIHGFYGHIYASKVTKNRNFHYVYSKYGIWTHQQSKFV